MFVPDLRLFDRTTYAYTKPLCFPPLAPRSALPSQGFVIVTYPDGEVLRNSQTLNIEAAKVMGEKIIHLVERGLHVVRDLNPQVRR